jgi:hypothetical protein
MNWINEHKRNVRIVFLILLVIAINGPWVFDRINVPSPYTCSAPNVRLDDKFCGLPLSITWIFPSIMGDLSYIIIGLATGTLSFGDAARESLFFLFLFLLLLPVLNIAILILRGDAHRRWHMLHTVGLTLAAGIGGWMAWLSYSRASWMLWGLWHYIGQTVSMCILEVLIRIKASQKPMQEQQSEP